MSPIARLNALSRKPYTHFPEHEFGNPLFDLRNIVKNPIQGLILRTRVFGAILLKPRRWLTF